MLRHISSLGNNLQDKDAQFIGKMLEVSLMFSVTFEATCNMTSVNVNFEIIFVYTTLIP